MNDQEQDGGLQQAQFVLITGGARSGKSTLAERMAAESGKSVAMVATAVASDDDMRARIARHKAQRFPSWQTIEEPLHIAQAVQHATTLADVVLVDCITTWLGNWLFARHGEDAVDEMVVSTQDYGAALQEIDELCHVITTLPVSKAVLLVTNEVGLGIVPAYALGRVYRDVLGMVNQRLAQSASRVYLMVAGMAVDVKRLAEAARLL